MLERKDGVIINVNSISGKRANPLAGAGYAAAKFGMHALAGCLASEEKESGIRVSNIYPGEIDTPILEVRPDAGDRRAAGEDSEGRGRGRGDPVRRRSAAACVGAGVDHQADSASVFLTAHLRFTAKHHADSLP